MLCAYLSGDEVSRHEASEMGAAHGFAVENHFPHQRPETGAFAAVVHDLDSTPAEQRRQTIADLCRHRAGVPTAVHSYALYDGQVTALESRGVVVRRTLDPTLFEQLARHVRGTACVAPEQAADVPATSE